MFTVVKHQATYSSLFLAAHSMLYMRFHAHRVFNDLVRNLSLNCRQHQCRQDKNVLQQGCATRHELMSMTLPAFHCLALNARCCHLNFVKPSALQTALTGSRLFVDQEAVQAYRSASDQQRLTGLHCEAQHGSSCDADGPNLHMKGAKIDPQAPNNVQLTSCTA